MSPSKKANKTSKTSAAVQKKRPAGQPLHAPANPAKATAEKTAGVQKAGSGAKRSVRKAAAQAAPAVVPVEMAAASPVSVPPAKAKTSLPTNLLRVLALLAVIGITVYIYSIRSRVEEFERFGYAGIFIIALMANATVLMPAPGVAIIYAMGAVFNPLWVGLAAGTGGALGELSGYLAGFSGQAIVERTHLYERLHPWVEKYGGWAVFVLSAIPNPFFDVAGIAAGMVKLPVQTFLVFTWAGQIIKMLFFAMAGYYSLEWLTNFMR